MSDVDLDSVRYFNGRPVYLDRNGDPLTLREWATAFEDTQGRTLARTPVGECEVITMWMGVDHDPLDEGPPLIFGTIVRRGREYADEVESPTEEAAMEAHWTLVQRLSER